MKIITLLLILSAAVVFFLIAGVSEWKGNKNGAQIAFRLASIAFIVLTSLRALVSTKKTQLSDSNSESKDSQK